MWIDSQAQAHNRTFPCLMNFPAANTLTVGCCTIRFLLTQNRKQFCSPKWRRYCHGRCERSEMTNRNVCTNINLSFFSRSFPYAKKNTYFCGCQIKRACAKEFAFSRNPIFNTGYRLIIISTGYDTENSKPFPLNCSSIRSLVNMGFSGYGRGHVHNIEAMLIDSLFIIWQISSDNCLFKSANHAF